MDKTRSNNLIGSIEILITGIIWGFIGFFVKELIAAGSTPALSAFFRVAFAFLFAAIVALFMYGPRSFILTREQFIWCLLDGILTQGVYNYCYSICVEKTGVAIASVLLYTSPVFNAIISYLVFKERLGFKRNIILVINLIGSIIAATALDFSFKTVSFFGIFMGLMSGLTYGAAPVLGKYVNRNPNLFVVIAYNEFFATIFMLIFLKPFDGVKVMTSKLLLYGALYGILITGIAYMFYYDGIKRMSEMSLVPVIASIEIVVAAFVGVLIYKEPLNIINYIGIALVILSIVLMSLASRRRLNNVQKMS
ncbi:MAG: EamA family transporter [Lachnospiraceae bacterium]|nr:EamA family transporter [Lachnospiraceae bacterium]